MSCSFRLPKRQRQVTAGRVPVDGRDCLTVEQWKHMATTIGEIESAVAEFGLMLVFHPHLAT
jgi:hypothetical protein